MKRGVEQLIAWMERRGLSQRETAAMLDWHETHLCHLLAGRRSPELESAIKIERVTGIPVEAWVSSAVDSPVEPVGARARKRK